MRLIRNRVLWVVLAASLIYWVGAKILPTQPFLEFVRIMQSTMALVALVALSHAIWCALVTDDPDRADVLTLGVALKEFAFWVTGLWLLMYRLAGPPGHRPEWMLDVLFFGFLAGWLPALSSLVLVSVPGILIRDDKTGESVPPLTLILVGAVAGLGLFATLAVLAIQPDALWLVEHLKPWIR